MYMATVQTQKLYKWRRRQTTGGHSSNACQHNSGIPALWLDWYAGCLEGCNSRKAATMVNKAYDPMPPWYTYTHQVYYCLS